MSLHDRFEAINDEYLKFDRIENKRSNRPDLHAFLLLDELQPNAKDMVSGAGHDEIFLDIDCDKLEKIITDDQILQLVRCGVWHDEYTDSLGMFA